MGTKVSKQKVQLTPPIQSPQQPLKKPAKPVQTLVQPLPPPAPNVQPRSPVLLPLTVKDGSGQPPATPLEQKRLQEVPGAAVAASAGVDAQPTARAKPGVVDEAQSPRASLKQTPSQAGTQQERKMSLPPPVAPGCNIDRQSLQPQVLSSVSAQKNSDSTTPSPAAQLSQEQMIQAASVAVVQTFPEGTAQAHVKLPAPNCSLSQPERSSTPVAAAGAAALLAATIGPSPSEVARADQEPHEPVQYMNVIEGEVQMLTHKIPDDDVNKLSTGVTTSTNLILHNPLDNTTLTLLFMRI